ncbi:hypothetical protein OOK41_23235 [Micromonospora sp. NBC_01655]|uniref:hypothetical protein n=1 Tax=Micromonospora sp. NBC_01655 TaxID=2975983 RepID=UPI0022536BAF|nr:hypothetical protein [Micromonospora sp. NBC_01655]MCX4473183.1 hypothetical protein [Micromonospora sp. NBC_01655]
MSRKELVIPRQAAASLRFPPVSLADGSPAAPLAVRPWRASLFRRSRTVTLPFDPRSAGRMRRALTVQRLETLLLGPARLVVVAIGTASLLRAWLELTFSHLPYVLVFAALVLEGVSSYLGAQVIPPQYPRERRGGALSIRDVPEGVADQWIAMNPGVRSGTPRD